MSDVGCEANRRWRKEEFLFMLIFSSCWIRHISNVDYYINRWSWTDFIVDVGKKRWTADWLLMLILIRWILHHSAYHIGELKSRRLPRNGFCQENYFPCLNPLAALCWRLRRPKIFPDPKGQPRSTRNEFPIRAYFGKLTAKGAVLSLEKRDFTVLLTKFAFIGTFEEFLFLYSEQSFYKCLINLSCPAGPHSEENCTVQRDILRDGNICWHVHHL